MKGKGQTIHEHIRIEAYLLSEKAGHPTAWTTISGRRRRPSSRPRGGGRRTAAMKAAETKAKAKPAAKVKPAAEAQDREKGGCRQRAAKKAAASRQGRGLRPGSPGCVEESTAKFWSCRGTNASFRQARQTRTSSDAVRLRTGKAASCRRTPDGLSRTARVGRVALYAPSPPSWTASFTMTVA